ncbi:MAG: PRC-barrel domain-containing protein [Pseudomonadota bacterium]
MKLMTTTAAAVAIAATGAIAASDYGSMRTEMHNNSAMSAMSTEELGQAQGDLIRSRDITGGTIYTMNQADDEGWDPEFMYENVNADWAEIGSIEDLILTKDGQITGIVAEVGGFLDVGDKHVKISVKDLNLVAVDDQTYAYVTRFNEEDLEAMEGVDEGFWN